MIQGDEEESIYYSGTDFFVRRNHLCEAVYIEYDPENKMHKAVAQYGAHGDKRLELFSNHSKCGRMSNEDLCHKGWDILCTLQTAYKAGVQAKIDEIKEVLNIVDPRR